MENTLSTDNKALNWVIEKSRYFGSEEFLGETFHTWIFEGKLPHNMRREIRYFIHGDEFYMKNNWLKVGNFEVKLYIPDDVYKECRVDITQIV